MLSEFKYTTERMQSFISFNSYVDIEPYTGEMEVITAQKWSFPIGISSVNVNKSAGNEIREKIRICSRLIKRS